MKKFYVFLMLMLLTISAIVPVFADEQIGSGIAGEVIVETDRDKSDSTTRNNSSVGDALFPEIDVRRELGIDTVTAQDANNWIQRKGNDVISIMISIAQYVCYGAFVIGGGMFLIGLFANKKMALAGLFTLIVAGIIYATAVCSPEIVRAVAGWAAS